MFGYSKYKMYYIENLLPPEGSTVYKCGTLVDLCLGPHIQNTGKIKAFQVMKVANYVQSCPVHALTTGRALRVIFEATKTTIHYSESMVSPFLTRSR